MNENLRNALIIGAVILALMIVSSIVGGGAGMMGAGMMGGGFGIFSWLIGLVILGLLIWGVVLLVKGIAGSGGGGLPAGESALEILKKRYARGEINKEEFEQKKKDLS